MTNTLVIAWKEMRVYFGSPIAYVIMFFFVGFTGFLFVNSLTGAFREASLREFLVGDPIGGGVGSVISGALVLAVLAPALTMRLLAEETKMGTIELLLTSPIRDYEVVMGKFLAALAAVLMMVVLTLYYPILLIIFANPDPGPIAAGYFGFILMGGLFVSVGLFASSLTNNQIVAAVVSAVALLAFWFINEAAEFFTGTAGDILEFVSVRTHFSDFARGIIDTQSVIYYLALTAIFLFLTVRSLESRRWR